MAAYQQYSEEIGQMINTKRAQLAEETVALHYTAQPDLMIRYGPAGRTKCLRDVNYHLSYLSQALALSTPELFTDYVAWAKAMLSGHNVPAADLMVNLVHLRDAVKKLLPDTMQDTVVHYVEAGIEECRSSTPMPPSFLQGAEPHADLAKQYLDALLIADQFTASTLIFEAVRGGVSVRDLYVYVFQRSQQEIGRLWQLNQLSVAQEHYCTAATQLIMSQLYPYILTSEKKQFTLVAACVAGDLHQLGVRMVADHFEMAGWKTVYLGANTPTPDIVKMVVEQKAHILALSATMTYHLQAVVDVIKAVRASEAKHIKILVGGYPFNLVPDLWTKIGADGYASDAATTLEVANSLVTM